MLSRISLIPFFLATLVSLSVPPPNTPREEPKAKVCLTQTHCYDLPISESIRDWYNKTGKENNFRWDFLTGDSCLWNYCAKLYYVNPVNEEINRDAQKVMPNHPIIVSFFALSCRNLSVLNDMAQGPNPEEARNIVRRAFAQKKEARKAELQKRIQELSIEKGQNLGFKELHGENAAFDEMIAKIEAEIADTERLISRVSRYALVEPIDFAAALNTTCRNERGEIEFYDFDGMSTRLDGMNIK